jgi:hypothetical protein
MELMHHMMQKMQYLNEEKIRNKISKRENYEKRKKTLNKIQN